MRIVGVRSVPLSSLYLDGAFAKRLAEIRIEDREKSIRDNGLLYEPLVRESDMRVIDGRDRIAAVMRLGWTEIDVKLIECTDLECEAIERITTVERRHDAVEQKRCVEELVELYSAQFSTEPRVPGKGRPRSPRTRARAQVEAETGVKSETIRKREQRAKKKADVVPDLLPSAPTVRTLGIDVTPEFLAEVEQVQKELDAVATLLGRAQGALTALEKTNLPIPPGVQRLKEEIHGCAAAARGLRPESLCPHCKGLEGVQEVCLCCCRLAYITASQVPQIPKALWDETHPVVTIAGRLVPWRDAAMANDVTRNVLP